MLAMRQRFHWPCFSDFNEESTERDEKWQRPGFAKGYSRFIISSLMHTQCRRAIPSRLRASVTVAATAAARGVSCGSPKYFANKVQSSGALPASIAETSAGRGFWLTVPPVQEAI